MIKKSCEEKEVCGCRCHHEMMPGNYGNCKDCPDCKIIKVALRPCNCQDPTKIPWAEKAKVSVGNNGHVYQHEDANCDKCGRPWSDNSPCKK